MFRAENSLITEEQQKQWYLSISLLTRLSVSLQQVYYFVVFIFDNNAQFREYLICNT